MEKATREQTKTHNTSLVLRTVYQQGETSRADVARITQLTRTTVSEIVAGLIEDGLLEETGVGTSAGGKPPILLRLREDARQVICLDLSEANFRGAIVNLRGKICARASVPRDGENGEPPVENVFRLVDALLPSVSAPLLGIGVGAPGLIDVEKGIVRRSVHLQWNDLPLERLLTGRYALPVYLMNDSHASALAEFTFGKKRQSPNLIVVRIGEGIGSGILLSGQIHFGDGFGAGEIGHLTVVEGGQQCSCGNFGCLETVAAPGAIVKRLKELAEYEWIRFVTPPSGRPAEINWDFVRQAFAAGDDTVTELIKDAGHYLGISIANLVSILNVQRIVINGAYVEFGETFLNAVSSELRRRALFTTAVETEISNSDLGADAVALGVSALVLSNEIGLP